VNLFETSEIIEGWYKSEKNPEAMKYRSHEVIHVAETNMTRGPID
jgi:hypothetical protein